MTNDAEIFEAERPRLRAIAYRITGSPDDANDVVQDTWMRYQTVDAAGIENVPAWLTTVSTRLAIDRLRATRRRRESYVGPWLSEPIVDEPALDPEPVDAVLLAESLSLGFLAVLERTTPLERAVLILHDVFGYPLADIADIIDRSPSATRQLAKRARDHVRRERPRFQPDPADVIELTQRVLAAAADGDLETLTSYLADDVVHISDGGAHHHAARVPVVGAPRVARLFVGLAKRLTAERELHVVRANGQVALYVTEHEQPYMLHVANWVDGRLVASFAVRNPDKLAAFHRSWARGR